MGEETSTFDNCDWPIMVTQAIGGPEENCIAACTVDGTCSALYTLPCLDFSGFCFYAGLYGFCYQVGFEAYNCDCYTYLDHHTCD